VERRQQRRLLVDVQFPRSELSCKQIAHLEVAGALAQEA